MDCTATIVYHITDEGDICLPRHVRLIFGDADACDELFSAEKPFVEMSIKLTHMLPVRTAAHVDRELAPKMRFSVVCKEKKCAYKGRGGLGLPYPSEGPAEESETPTINGLLMVGTRDFLIGHAAYHVRTLSHHPLDLDAIDVEVVEVEPRLVATKRPRE